MSPHWIKQENFKIFIKKKQLEGIFVYAHLENKCELPFECPKTVGTCPLASSGKSESDVTKRAMAESGA